MNKVKKPEQINNIIRYIKWSIFQPEILLLILLIIALMR
jgi:hypothetical protein